MLPGKSYSPEDILKLARKRVWFLLVPAALILAVTALIARRLPDLYKSETVILVVPQRVPDTYVRAPVTSPLEDRLLTIKPTILSRTRLEQIIQDLNLYPDERRRMVLEDVVALMRANIDVQTKQSDSFSVSYVGRNPRQVMDVTQRLATFFINESLKNRFELAKGTDEFLDSRLREAKQRLLENEERLKKYREQHSGELPSQFESNLQQVKNAQAQVQSSVDTVNRLLEQKIVRERRLAELEAAAPTDGGVVAEPTQGQTPTVSLDQQLDQANAVLAAQEASGLKAGHPDLELTKRRIRDLTRQIAALPTAPGADARRITPAESLRRKQIKDAQDDIAQLDEQIATARTAEKQYRLDEQVAQRRLDALPTREAELVELTRDYSTIDGQYKSLAAKKEDAQMAADLEKKQIGEQFQILDPAPLPERPFSPNRQRILAMALAGGLALGLAFIALFEYRDRSLKSDTDVVAVVKLPVLAVVPAMQSTTERRRGMVRSMALNAGLGMVVLVCLGVVAYALKG